MFRDCYHTSISMDHQRRAHEYDMTIIKRLWRRGGEEERRRKRMLERILSIFVLISGKVKHLTRLCNQRSMQ